MKKIRMLLVVFVLVFALVGVEPSVLAAAPKSITISKTSKTVYIGQKYKLKVTAVKPAKADTEVQWKTSDRTVATVDRNGVVTGKKKGTATITAVSKSNNKIKAKCKVTVKKYKNTIIDYEGKIVNYNKGYTLIHYNFKNNNHQDPHIIRTYDQLKALKKEIKKNYDINNFYDSDSVWYHDEDFADGKNGDEILEILNKYNKKFFETNVLYYNCIDYSTEVENQEINFAFKCTKVEKKINSDGKLTCNIHIKRSVKKVKNRKNTTVDDNTAVYFVELKKSDISGVQAFKLMHYEYFDLEHIDSYVNED